MGKHKGGHHGAHSSSSSHNHSGMQRMQHAQMYPNHVQPGMHVRPGWPMQPMQYAPQPGHDGMSDTTLEFGGTCSGSDESEDYSDSASSSKTRTRSKHHSKKRKSKGRHTRHDKKSKKSKPGKKKDKKCSSSDDQDAAAFPGTTYRYLGGKELPGSSAERAKQSYPKTHKVAILKEMCPIITLTRSAGGVVLCV